MYKHSDDVAPDLDAMRSDRAGQGCTHNDCFNSGCYGMGMESAGRKLELELVKRRAGRSCGSEATKTERPAQITTVALADACSLQPPLDCFTTRKNRSIGLRRDVDSDRVC
jgi:hypothetical protein